MTLEVLVGVNCSWFEEFERGSYVAEPGKRRGELGLGRDVTAAAAEGQGVRRIRTDPNRQRRAGDPCQLRIVVVFVLRGAKAQRAANGATDRESDVVGGGEDEVAGAAGRRNGGVNGGVGVGDSGK